MQADVWTIWIQQYKNKHQNQQQNKDSENKNFNKTLKNLNLYFINRKKERSQDPYDYNNQLFLICHR